MRLVSLRTDHLEWPKQEKSVSEQQMNLNAQTTSRFSWDVSIMWTDVGRTDVSRWRLSDRWNNSNALGRVDDSEILGQRAGKNASVWPHHTQGDAARCCQGQGQGREVRGWCYGRCWGRWRGLGEFEQTCKALFVCRSRTLAGGGLLARGESSFCVDGQPKVERGHGRNFRHGGSHKTR